MTDRNYFICVVFKNTVMKIKLRNINLEVSGVIDNHVDVTICMNKFIDYKLLFITTTKNDIYPDNKYVFDKDITILDEFDLHLDNLQDNMIYEMNRKKYNYKLHFTKIGQLYLINNIFITTPRIGNTM